jgi:hypothetical protein
MHTHTHTQARAQTHTHTHTDRQIRAHSHTYTNKYKIRRTFLDKRSVRCGGVYLHNTKYSQRTHIHAFSGIQALNPSKRVAADLTPSTVQPPWSATVSNNTSKTFLIRVHRTFTEVLQVYDHPLYAVTFV